MTDGIRKVGNNFPPLPNPPKTQYNNSIITHDINIDVESFIKHDLIKLNQNQYQLQQELRELHINHKTEIKDVYSKFNIKTDYKHSGELTGDPTDSLISHKNENDIE